MTDVRLARCRVEPGKADAAGDEEAFDIDAEHHAVLRDCLTGEWEPLDTIGHYTNPERG